MNDAVLLSQRYIGCSITGEAAVPLEVVFSSLVTRDIQGVGPGGHSSHISFDSPES